MTESREVGETIGYQLRRLRRLRGLTQEALADRANVSRDLVCKLEQGRRHTARITSLASLAHALDVELSALVERATPVLEIEDGDEAGLVALRNALTSLPVSGEEDPTPVDMLRRSLDEAWHDYWAGRYGRLCSTLPGLLGEARQSANAEVLAGVYQVASCVLCQVGKDVLAYIAVDRGIQAAEQGDDELLHAASDRPRSLRNPFTAPLHWATPVERSNSRPGFQRNVLPRLPTVAIFSMSRRRRSIIVATVTPSTRCWQQSASRGNGCAIRHLRAIWCSSCESEMCRS